MTDDPLVDTREAARILGVREGLLVRWRYEQKGPPYLKLSGGTVRYQIRDLSAFMESRRVTTNAV
jgi:hypothetical protein